MGREIKLLEDSVVLLHGLLSELKMVSSNLKLGDGGEMEWGTFSFFILFFM